MVLAWYVVRELELRSAANGLEPWRGKVIAQCTNEDTGNTGEARIRKSKERERRREQTQKQTRRRGDILDRKLDQNLAARASRFVSAGTTVQNG